MDAHKKVLEGIMLLDSLPQGEIEERIEWLEQALEAYKLILNYKILMRNKPHAMEVPEVTNVTLKVVESNGHSRNIHERLFEYMRQNDRDISITELANVLDVTKSNITSCIQRHRILYEHPSHGYWRVKGQYALRNNEVEPGTSEVGDSPLQS